MQVQWIDNVRNWWKIWSVQAFSVIALLSLIQGHWEAYKNFVPEQYHGYVIAFFSFVGLIARLLKQIDLSQPGDENA